ncbi:hypothetical protein [Actinotignum timonense]|nr:hypothetical protein [Actinotignum timonense]MDK6590737.1 hypothetical protein [Actinotignum timonense]
MRSQTHRVVATALTAGVAVALVPAGTAQAGLRTVYWTLSLKTA